jgi:preprotein translocase subunit SecY
VVIPRLEALKKEGQAGQTKITQYTRYLTLGLALLQATGIVALARSGNLLRRRSNSVSSCCTTTAPARSSSWSSR